MSYDSAILADGPVSYWKLNETTGTTAADIADSNPGTFTGTYTLNQAGPSTLKGVLLDGTSGYVDCGTASNTDLNRNFTLEAWIKTTGNGAIMSRGTSGWYFRVSGGKLNLLKSQIVDVLHGSVTVNDNNWHHVIVSVTTGGTISCYVDGVPETTGSAGATGFSGGLKTTIGRETSGSGGSEFLPGTISAVAVYNYVLTPAQILNHYQTGLGSIALQGSSAGKSTPSATLTVVHSQLGHKTTYYARTFGQANYKSRTWDGGQLAPPLPPIHLQTQLTSGTTLTSNLRITRKLSAGVATHTVATGTLNLIKPSPITSKSFLTASLHSAPSQAQRIKLTNTYNPRKQLIGS